MRTFGQFRRLKKVKKFVSPEGKVATPANSNLHPTAQRFLKTLQPQDTGDRQAKVRRDSFRLIKGDKNESVRRKLRRYIREEWGKNDYGRTLTHKAKVGPHKVTVWGDHLPGSKLFGKGRMSIGFSVNGWHERDGAAARHPKVEPKHRTAILKHVASKIKQLNRRFGKTHKMIYQVSSNSEAEGASKAKHYARFFDKLNKGNT